MNMWTMSTCTMKVKRMSRNNDPYELKFTCTVGSGIREEFKRKLRTFAFMNDVKLDIDEDKGFLTSHFLVRAEGKKVDLEAIEQWIRKI